VWLLPFVDFCGSIRALLWIAHPIQFGYTSPIRAATETSRECLVFVCHSMFQDWHDSLFDTISLVPKRCTLVTCFPAIVKNDKALLVVIFAELFQGPVTGAMYQSKFWVIDNSSNALRPTWNVKLVDPIVRSTIMEGYPLNQQVPPEQWVRYGYNSPTDTISKEQEQGVMIIMQMNQLENEKTWMPWHECRTGILDNAASGCVWHKQDHFDLQKQADHGHSMICPELVINRFLLVCEISHEGVEILSLIIGWPWICPSSRIFSRQLLGIPIGLSPQSHQLGYSSKSQRCDRNRQTFKLGFHARRSTSV